MNWLLLLLTVAVAFYLIGKSKWMRAANLRSEVRERLSALGLGLLSVDTIMKRIAWTADNEPVHQQAVAHLSSAWQVCDSILALEVQGLESVLEPEHLFVFRQDLDEALKNVHRARVLVEPFDPWVDPFDEDLSSGRQD